jgi:hypothetical protein
MVPASARRRRRSRFRPVGPSVNQRHLAAVALTPCYVVRGDCNQWQTGKRCIADSQTGRLDAIKSFGMLNRFTDVLERVRVKRATFEVNEFIP